MVITGGCCISVVVYRLEKCIHTYHEREEERGEMETGRSDNRSSRPHRRLPAVNRWNMADAGPTSLVPFKTSHRRPQINPGPLWCLAKIKPTFPLSHFDQTYVHTYVRMYVRLQQSAIASAWDLYVYSIDRFTVWILLKWRTREREKR